MSRALLKSCAAALACGVICVLQTNVAHAAWNQNDIIDDNVFNNTASMNATQIDTFLNAFPNSCISTNHGFSAPDPTGYSPSPSSHYIYGGNVSAGNVINDAAQAYDLNPQVILATLQKEQSLVDGSAGCSTLRYTGAMGLGCPDSGGTYNYSGLNLYTLNGSTVSSVSGTCVNDSRHAGFSQQVISGAWLLKFSQQRALGNMGWSIVKGSWDNSDDPQSCYSGPVTAGYRQICPSGGTSYFDGTYTIDGSAVHMYSGATASLYNYTPHFHGNQLFDSVWEAWWGATLTGTYLWSTSGYQLFTADGVTSVDPGHLQAGQTYLAKLTATNTGTAIWYNSGPTPVRLAATAGNSQFCIAGWIACSRPALLNESTVAPGAQGTFTFQFHAPYTPGDYRENFKPVAEMLSWTNDTYGESFGVHVDNPGSFQWSTDGYQIFDKNDAVRQDPGRLSPGEIYIAKLDVINRGSATWYKQSPTPMELGTVNSSSSLCLPGTWMACNRPASLAETSVAPGQIGEFKFRFQAPYTLGSYREDFKPLAEFLSWTNDAIPNQTFGIVVTSPGTYRWSTTGYQIQTTDLSSTMDPGHLAANTNYTATLTATNTGTATWYNNSATPMRLGIVNKASSQFCIAGWIACNRPAALTESSIAPGQTGHFTFTFKTPATPGSYREDFKPLAEMLSWTNDNIPAQTFGIIVY